MRVKDEKMKVKEMRMLCEM